jgi:diaminohydroxyphosphoribosylaminopyrimidine deaminase / 5-amino-6-(5-phosphoribosylamino)uracil reductase
MKLRQGSDAILVGVNTVLIDDPSLTVRSAGNIRLRQVASGHPTSGAEHPRLRRIVLDSMARTPVTAKVVSDEHAALTTIVVSHRAPKTRVAALTKRVSVVIAPPAKAGGGLPCPPRCARGDARCQRIDLPWLLKKLGSENVASLLVEGGGEVNASFLLGGLAHRVAFFYAPKILGGRGSRPAVAGEGATSLPEMLQLTDIEWGKLGPDLLLTARVKS